MASSWITDSCAVVRIMLECEMKNKRIYNKRAWLNSKSSPSTGSIVCYCGPDIWESTKTSMFIEVSSCSSVARLHHSGNESKSAFIAKAKRMRDELDSFICFLESNNGD